MKYILSIFFLFNIGFASAQYSTFLKVQEDEDIKKMKSNKIQFVQVVQMEEGKNDTFFSTLAFDTSGRRIFVKTNDKVIAYLYDNEGRLIHQRDSLFNGPNSSVTELNCKYDPQTGKLKSYKTENLLCDFMYKPQSRELFEQVVQAKGPVLRRYYKYDDKDRMIYRLFADQKGNPQEEEKIQYTFFNKPDNIRLTNFKPNYAKTLTVSSYTYNSEKKLTGKIVNVVDNYGDETAEKNGFTYKPTNTNQFYNFEYDTKGNLIKEIFKNTASDRLNYIINRDYYDNGLLKSETFINNSGQTLYTLSYDYAKFGEVKLPKPPKKKIK